MANKKRTSAVWLTAGAALGAALVWQYTREKRTALAPLRQHSRMIDTDVGPVEVAITGDGPPVLVFHGGMGGCEHGPLLADLLGLHAFRVIAPSRPGYRRTPITAGQTPAQQADAARAVLDELGIEAAAVMGFSGGGISALTFAAHFPERCRKLVMLSAHGPSLKQHQPDRIWLVLMRAMLASDFFMWVVTKLGITALTRLSGNAGIEPDFRRFFRAMFPASDWRTGTLNDLEQIYTLEDIPLERIQAPTLLLHGDDDRNVLYPVAVHSAGRIPTAELHTIPGGTHLIFISHQTELGEIIREFLRHP